jgi:hypothetical protein
MKVGGQDQSGGTGSTNYQARRDIVQTGVSAAEAREIALDVYHSNFLTLRGIAEEVAADRAERITREFLDRLQSKNARRLSSMQDPDMLSVVFAAQAGFARSGEADLEAALVDLLVDRAGQQERNLKTLVLNEAIQMLPKLTSVQRRALAVFFVFRDTSVGELDTIDAHYSRIARWTPIFEIGSLKRADLQYLESAGAGSIINLSSVPLGTALANNYRGFYTKGFAIDDGIPDDLSRLVADRELFIPCLRDPDKLQINAVSSREVAELAGRKSIEADLLESFANVGVMRTPEIEAELIERIPEAAILVERWQKCGLAAFESAAAGVAIGHAYWSQVVPANASAPLDVWLSD